MEQKARERESEKAREQDKRNMLDKNQCQLCDCQSRWPDRHEPGNGCLGPLQAVCPAGPPQLHPATQHTRCSLDARGFQKVVITVVGTVPDTVGAGGRDGRGRGGRDGRQGNNSREVWHPTAPHDTAGPGGPQCIGQQEFDCLLEGSTAGCHSVPKINADMFYPGFVRCEFLKEKEREKK